MLRILLKIGIFNHNIKPLFEIKELLHQFQNGATSILYSVYFCVAPNSRLYYLYSFGTFRNIKKYVIFFLIIYCVFFAQWIKWWICLWKSSAKLCHKCELFPGLRSIWFLELIKLKPLNITYHGLKPYFLSGSGSSPKNCSWDTMT